MKKAILLFLIISFFLRLDAQSYEKTTNGIKYEVYTTNVEVQFYSSKIVRVLKYPRDKVPQKKSLSVIKDAEKTDFKVKEYNNIIKLTSSDLIVSLNFYTGDVTFDGIDGRPLIAEKNTSTRFVEKKYESGNTYEVQQTFLLDKEEAIYGLGQHQQGHMNQRGQEIRLQQANTEIAIPIIHSVKGYAVLWDNYSSTTYKDSNEGLSFTSVAGKCVDYYFMYGKNADGTIAQIRELTGQAPMFPLWTYGFWQSRERYVSQDDLVNAVKRYRDLGVPLDGIIQDWQYWSTDNKRWNAIDFGNSEFPDPKKMVDEVHKMNAHIAISVWPSFGPNSEIHKELAKKEMLFNFDVFPQNNGVKVYDTFNPEARDIYWSYMDKNLFSLGIDGWWLDSTEPDDNITEEGLSESTYSGPLRDVRNAFPLMTVGGVYDHQRAVTLDKRVFILTRSAFAGQQRYGSNSWSGDIDSRWNVLHNQISAGLNFSLSGIPYWNTDIGGFWAGRAYPEGIKDKAFHELYVRWMQFATFTPMMRSHGTNTPREIYQFGKKGDWSFDVQEKYINLRYSLLPYIYSLGYGITAHSGTMMRALCMDFAQDKIVHDIDNQYMFGPSILVSPVTDSMYVNRTTGKAIVDFSKIKVKNIYLPEGVDWYDFWTGEKLKGGQTVEKETPIDIIPLYIKEGSILPWGPKVQYAEEKNWDDLNIFIYPGADSEFVLYEDENDNYNYEKGIFSTIKLQWNDKIQTLTVGTRDGKFPGMSEKRTFKISLLRDGKNVQSFLDKPDKSVVYEGQKLNIRF